MFMPPYMRYLTYGILSLTVSFAGWENIHTERKYSISGVAKFDSLLLVVHDNKMMNQPRISFLEKNMIKPISWPLKDLPYDLEGIYAIPEFPYQFILMESTGKCYKIELMRELNKIAVLNQFILPNLKGRMNLEGLALFKSKNHLKIFYGDRGSDTRKSTLFVGDYDHENDNISNVSSFEIDLPMPLKDKRNIGDLCFDNKNFLWSSATSDPGDNGPFSTYIYKIGRISESGYHPIPPGRGFTVNFDDQKVEAMTFEKGVLILLTDNENFGSSRNNYRIYK